jgi:hypothetical protein
MADPKYTADADYSAAEMVALTREAIARVIKLGVSYTVSGQTITRADLPTLRKELEHWTRAANQAAGNQSTNLARLRRGV